MSALEDRRTLQGHVRSNRVFVLGAGFSAAAGVPLTNELLRDSLKLFSLECPGIYSRVEGYAKEAIGVTVGNLDVANISFLNCVPSLNS